MATSVHTARGALALAIWICFGWAGWLAGWLVVELMMIFESSHARTHDTALPFPPPLRANLPIALSQQNQFSFPEARLVKVKSDSTLLKNKKEVTLMDFRRSPPPLSPLTRLPASPASVFFFP
jgi:hypothetical protein